MATDAYEGLTALRHRYRYRAAHELALCCLRRGNYRGAKQYADEVLEEARAQEDQRWSANANIVLCRARRAEKRFTEAQKHADSALAAGRSSDNLPCVIDGLFECAEVLLAKAEAARVDAQAPAGSTLVDMLEEAERHLREILAKSADNPKIQGVAHLHLARRFLREGRTREGHVEYLNWQAKASAVESGFARTLSAALGPKFALTAFSVLASTPPKFDRLQAELRRFLLRAADDGRSTEEERAEFLGIARSTLAKWRKESLPADSVRKGKRRAPSSKS